MQSPSLRFVLIALSLCSSLAASDLVVAPSGGAFTSIQAALNAAAAGDRVLVQDKPGGWNERLVFPSSGTLAAPIELLAAAGHAPILDGTGLPGIWMITIQDQDHVHITGIEIRNNLGVVNDGSGIRVQGACTGIEIRDCTIHDMRGFGAMAITVYGENPTASINDLVIDGCLIYDCEPADSEAITLNGNVTNFVVSNNVVRDVNNIGIDFIGGEFGPGPEFQARDGVCRGNVVLRANSNYEGGYGAGIYVDGGRDILIERNYVSGCDLGIEVGAENAGVNTTNVVVHSNLIVANEKVGLIFGGYDLSVGRVEDCTFVNNTLYHNDTLQDGNGELWIQFANNCLVAHNSVWPGPGNLAVSSGSTTNGIVLDRNHYFADVAANLVERRWLDVTYAGLAAWTSATGFDTTSLFGDPLFADIDGADDSLGTPDDVLRPLVGSPLLDAGQASFVHVTQQLDYAGAERVLGGVIDLGAFEVLPASSSVRNGNGSNPLLLQEVQSAVLGGNWIGNVGTVGAPAGTLTLVLITSASVPGLSTAFGELLIATEALGAATYVTSLVAPVAGSATHQASLPSDPGLLGLQVHAQGLLTTSPLQLTNALELVLGY